MKNQKKKNDRYIAREKKMRIINVHHSHFNRIFFSFFLWKNGEKNLFNHFLMWIFFSVFVFVFFPFFLLLRTENPVHHMLLQIDALKILSIYWTSSSNQYHEKKVSMMMKFDGFLKIFSIKKMKNEKFNFKLNHGQDFLRKIKIDWFIQIEWTTLPHRSNR